MSEHKIEKLQEVLSGYIKKSQIISDKKITNLTAPGENFGSVMLKLDITLKDEKDGTEEELHAVAKMIPARESQRTLFNIQVTFKNEIGYGVVDRHVGFDLETAQLILKDLAAFHAIPLALKLRKPEVFESKIRPYLARFVRPSSPHNEQLYSTFIEIFQESNKCVPWMPKMKEVLKINETLQNAAPREPFSTIIHGDAWVNNIMLKFQNRLPVGDKLIDFQICDYNSPAIDVFFFLFTSVQLSVLQDNFDGLIEFYHKHFISHLEKLKCDTAPFSLPKFLEEMKAATPFHLLHTIFMLLLVVFGKKEGSSIDFDPELLLENDRVRANIIPAGKEKVWYLIHTCGTRGWLE
ncbi:uncharacterized protein LOC108909861 isoform X2 [Anoplophora glabripennis]|uniref:uncharacterized protein LOC108909861 isoform X2 n=1 Tax=Anoplophora glabripennis TaxID=217634 RepID=UPI000873C6B8|nr:uncharacterized protein LOC108909861 isoform X2 [Anoplophora glabripennis]